MALGHGYAPLAKCRCSRRGVVVGMWATATQ